MQDVCKKLTKIIKANENFIIMTHSHPDLDAIGSSLGMYKIIKSFGKNCKIVKGVAGSNNAVNKALKMLSTEENIEWISKKEALETITEDTVLIILDTLKKELVESPALIDKTNNIILLSARCPYRTFLCAFIYNLFLSSQINK